MQYGVVFLLVIGLTICGCDLIEKIKGPSDPDMHRNVSELISSKGYPVEEHSVRTQDGYILSVQRIPYGKKSPSGNDKKPVIFLQHGFLCSAADWVLNFPHQSLGFLLADAGYDVWLGNNRGNTYSRKHVKYTTDDKEFWDFSINEYAEYDMTAMIDYVLESTGEKKLYVIGHSLGAGQTFALLSESPEYNKKVNFLIALGPAVFLEHMKTPVAIIKPLGKEIELFLKLMGPKEFLPNNEPVKVTSELVCDTQAKFLCEELMFLLVGRDKAQLNETRMGVYTTHIPAGVSSKVLLHAFQWVNSKKFLKFDYGEKKNLQIYNQKTPPEFDLPSVKADVAIFWSTNDKLVDPDDIKNLEGKVKKAMVYSYHVPLPDFNHLDFTLAIDARKLLYDVILSLLLE